MLPDLRFFLRCELLLLLLLFVAAPPDDARFAGLPAASGASSASVALLLPDGGALLAAVTLALPPPPPVGEPSGASGVVGVDPLLLFSSCLRCWFFSIFSKARIMACILRSSRVSFLLSLAEEVVAAAADVVVVVVEVVGLSAVVVVVVVDAIGLVLQVAGTVSDVAGTTSVAEVADIVGLLAVADGSAVDSNELGDADIFWLEFVAAGKCLRGDCAVLVVVGTVLGSGVGFSTGRHCCCCWRGGDRSGASTVAQPAAICMGFGDSASVSLVHRSFSTIVVVGRIAAADSNGRRVAKPSQVSMSGGASEATASADG